MGKLLQEINSLIQESRGIDIAKKIPDKVIAIGIKEPNFSYSFNKNNLS